VLLVMAVGGCASTGSTRITGDSARAAGYGGPTTTTLADLAVGKIPPAQSVAAAAAPQAPARYKVRPGDTLSGVADRNKVGLSVLARANGLQPTSQVRTGQVLAVPTAGGASVPDNSTTVVLRRGETLSDLAARHRLSLGDVLAANPGLKPATVRAGQKVRLPGDVAMPAAPTMSAEEVALVKDASTAKPPSLTGDGFIWPVRGGRLVSAFGAKPDGTRNDGLDIGAPPGTPVLASENGIVVYAGDRVAGYGQLLLLRHAGGFTTAYAHNQALLVKVGDRVKRGQRIATVGSTGGVRAPQLHFELRAGRNAIDPWKYLEGTSPTQVASKG
jgi:murein DD-endopeptidase MepM/ murein hydrolase activator NlpD